MNIMKAMDDYFKKRNQSKKNGKFKKAKGKDRTVKDLMDQYFGDRKV